MNLWNLALTGQVVLEKIFENSGRTDDGRTDDGPWEYYKLTNETKGSGELKISFFDFLMNFFLYDWFTLLYVWIVYMLMHLY